MSAIAKQDKQEPEVVALLQRMGPAIQRALPRHLSPERMARVALTALRQTPALLRCEPASVLGAIMSAAQLGLEPNTPLGLAYLIPYKAQCQLVIGYQGYLELARRSGLVSAPYAHVVREGDEFSFELGLWPRLAHVPSSAPDREQRPITHVYAVAHPRGEPDGTPLFVVLSRAQIDARRMRSAKPTSGPWKSDEEAMTLKTAIRALWRWLPKTAEMAQAAALDESETPEESWDQTTIDALESVDLTARVVAQEPEAIEAEAEPPKSKAARVMDAIGGAR